MIPKRNPHHQNVPKRRKDELTSWRSTSQLLTETNTSLLRLPSWRAEGNGVEILVSCSDSYFEIHVNANVILKSLQCQASEKSEAGIKGNFLQLLRVCFDELPVFFRHPLSLVGIAQVGEFLF